MESFFLSLFNISLQSDIFEINRGTQGRIHFCFFPLCAHCPSAAEVLGVGLYDKPAQRSTTGKINPCAVFVHVQRLMIPLLLVFLSNVLWKPLKPRAVRPFKHKLPERRDRDTSHKRKIQPARPWRSERRYITAPPECSPSLYS